MADLPRIPHQRIQLQRRTLRQRNIRLPLSTPLQRNTLEATARSDPAVRADRIVGQEALQLAIEPDKPAQPIEAARTMLAPAVAATTRAIVAAPIMLAPVAAATTNPIVAARTMLVHAVAVITRARAVAGTITVPPVVEQTMPATAELAALRLIINRLEARPSR